MCRTEFSVIDWRIRFDPLFLLVPFRQPKVGKPDVLSALAGATRKLLERANDQFGGKCDVFYAGSVVPTG
jgi:hypothetical protein